MPNWRQISARSMRQPGRVSPTSARRARSLVVALRSTFVLDSTSIISASCVLDARARASRCVQSPLTRRPARARCPPSCSSSVGSRVVATLEDLAAQRVDRLALLVHHVVVLEDVLALIEVAAFDLLLRVLDRARHHRRLDRHVLLETEALHEAGHAIEAEDAEQVVLQRQVEPRRCPDRPGDRRDRAAGCRCGATRGARCRRS